MRGRKPKPSNVHELHGNPGHRPRNLSEPRPLPKPPPCPMELDTVARREWRRVVKELKPLGLLSQLDRSTLAAYCQAWSRWLVLERALRQVVEGKPDDQGRSSDGVIVRTPAGYRMVHPLFGAVRRASDHLRACAVEFGMTPSARSRIEVGPLPIQDELGEFIARGKR